MDEDEKLVEPDKKIQNPQDFYDTKPEVEATLFFEVANAERNFLLTFVLSLKHLYPPVSLVIYGRS
jgi:hypothetical protein